MFIPLIVVNCIILGRAEGFCYKNGVAASAVDGVFQGIGYTWVLVVMCLVREFLGNGTILGGLSFLNDGNGIRILPEGVGALGISLPVGGFLVLACLIAFMQWALSRSEEKNRLRRWPSNGPDFSLFHRPGRHPGQQLHLRPVPGHAAPSWACPRRWTPLWAWAWP